MVKLIIEETGFPKNRETLKEFQDSFEIPIAELLGILPGRRILSGFVVTTDGGGNLESTEGKLVFDSKIWTIEPYVGTVAAAQYISFFEEEIALNFNVGTQINPIYEARPGKLRRYAQVGNLPGAVGVALRSSFVRGRRILEFLHAGSIFVGVVVIAQQTAVYHIAFPNIGTNDYQVLGNFRAADPAASFTRAFTWDVNNRNATGFDVMIDLATANSINLIFDFTVIPINR